MKSINLNFKLIIIWCIILCSYGCAPKIAPLQEITKESSLLDKIIERDTLKVGTTTDFLPFTYTNPETSNYQGIDIELAKDLAKSLNVNLLIVKTSWPTLLADLENGSYDIGMSGITINLKRQQQAFFSNPMRSSGKAAIARTEDQEKYTTIDAINTPEVRVIFNPGGTNETFARDNFPKAQLILNEDNLSIFQKIANGEVDVMVTDAIETLVQERIHPELKAINPDSPFNFFEMAYLLPRDVVFQAYINQWLNLRQKDGTYDTIFKSELERIPYLNKTQSPR
ncbi:transporter substrate-binding domain-containing protein [Cellulophaga baltica]|uniref:Cyclohexadienyl dehydratase n=1 Tax=Cellulophaga baltica TaxID=76594 RepID=A0A1G7H0S9_9FLAO|nr:transporter substrate-binding domain-containing protein [Cellulophaga baltica]MBA6315318.1 transporter substrate-binding domain-containing protein [Cellulophaga baltica]SDE93913.1 cyclohexadienyl dehydratase [Cellulophaga baltica]